MCNDVIQESVCIPGSQGRLVGELSYSVEQAVCACLLVNPHPYMGGRMENNVIARLATELAIGGAVTLRFDYSGVGKSEGRAIDSIPSMAVFWETGHAPEDPVMIEDVRCGMEWLRAQAGMPLVLVGYSFGAHAAVAAMTDDVTALVLISPTIRRHDFSALGRRIVPKLIVYSDNDFATPVEAAESWIASLAEPKVCHCVAAGEHFFRGQEGRVAQVCQEFLTGVMKEREDTTCHSA